MTDHILFRPNAESEAFTLRIRTALECAPNRAFERGGRFHQHPFHRILIEQNVVLEDDPDKWQLMSIRSVQPKVHTTFNQVKFTFADLDIKSKRTQTGESYYELTNYMWRAADPSIVDLELGGLQLRWDSPNGPRTYTADCVYTTADGQIFADEVKASNSYFIEPNYKARMKRVEQDLAAVGIGLNRVVASHCTELRVRRHNLSQAFLDRHTSFTQRQAEDVAELFERRSASASMAEVEEALNVDPRLRRQIVHAMLCHRKLAYCLDRSILPGTEVTAAPLAGNLPDLRSIDF